MLERIICIIMGYVFGLFQTSYIYGKIKGIDIREHGSGNAGATNALRTLGTKAGIIVFFGDALKCVFAIWLTRFLFESAFGADTPMICMYTAAGVILGHNFPFYLNFKGGKGIAATGGMLFAMHWIWVTVGLVVFALTFITTHYVSIGSILVYASFLICLFVMGQTGVLGVSQTGLKEMYVIAVLMMALAVWKHRENIVRLLNGTERKTYFKKK